MSLAPPSEPQHNVVDPGAHELQDSSDDHFSDAEEGKRLSAPPSPIPTTRVERVDDEPAYGEVPGTSAFQIRSQDAVPDEVEIIPDGQRSRSTSRLSESDRPTTPGGTLIPKMVVERLDDKPAHGEVPGTAAYEMRKADAEPDEVRHAPDEASASLERTSNPSIRSIEDRPTHHTTPFLTKKGSPTLDDRSRSPDHHQARSPPGSDVAVENDAQDAQDPATNLATESAPESAPVQQTVLADVIAGSAATTTAGDEYDEFNDGEDAEQIQHHDDGFGDDFDDFEEGAEAGEDDDFGDFDDGFEEPQAIPDASTLPVEPVQDPLSHLPNLTFASLQTPEDILKTITPHLSEIFPEIAIPEDSQQPISTQTQNPILTDRSASLWSQLVAPPPLQPPNWIRSRIRRLFLVSLGVPVDLDEILPASKQKKLILPNVNLAESQPRGSISRLRKEGHNASSSSISSTGEKKKKSQEKNLERRGPPPPPEFDANTAGLVSSTTEAAMQGFGDEELKEHVQRLETLISKASEVLEYWLGRKDSAMGDKEAFEGVIENLVGFVRRNRDSKVFK